MNIVPQNSDFDTREVRESAAEIVSILRNRFELSKIESALEGLSDRIRWLRDDDDDKERWLNDAEDFIEQLWAIHERMEARS